MKAKQSFLSLGLLLTSLMFMTGCSPDDSALISTNRRIYNDSYHTRTQGDTYNPNYNGSSMSWIPIQLGPYDYEGDPLNVIITDFVGEPLGNFHDIAVQISEGIASVGIWDQTGGSFAVDLPQQGMENDIVVFGDEYSSLYFVLEEDMGTGQGTFSVYIENYDDYGQVLSSGLVGFASVPFCQMESLC